MKPSRLGNTCRMLREAKGVSQTQLEERIGKEANYITRVETGRIDTPPLRRDSLASPTSWMCR